MENSNINSSSEDNSKSATPLIGNSPRQNTQSTDIQQINSRPHHTLLICLLVILTILGFGCGLTGFVLWQQEKNKSIDNTVDEDTENIEKPTEEGNEANKAITAASLKLTLENALNYNEPAGRISLSAGFTSFDVRLTQSGVGTPLGCDADDEGVLTESETTLTASISWDELYKMYNIDKQGEYQMTVPVEGIEAKHVVDIESSGFGNGIGYETIVFLMDDGTLEYMSLYQVAKESVVRVHGKIDGADDIIRIRTVSTSPGCGGGQSMIAQKSDGKFYDLRLLLDQQGAWNGL